MDFEKVERFLREHWPAAVMVVIIVAPSVWGLAYTFYGERIASLELHVQKMKGTIDELNERVRVLDQSASRRYEASGDQLRPDELYFPSPPGP